MLALAGARVQVRLELEGTLDSYRRLLEALDSRGGSVFPRGSSELWRMIGVQLDSGQALGIVAPAPGRRSVEEGVFEAEVVAAGDPMAVFELCSRVGGLAIEAGLRIRAVVPLAP